MKFLSIFIFILVCSTSTAVLPTYSPAIGDNTRTRDEIIENYFNLGLTAPEIALFLVSVHGIKKRLDAEDHATKNKTT